MSTYFLVDTIPGVCSEFAALSAGKEKLDNDCKALSAAKEILDNDRKALSEAEAALTADKHFMEQRAAIVRHQMQHIIAKQVSCMDGGVLDTAAAV